MKVKPIYLDKSLAWVVAFSLGDALQVLNKVWTLVSPRKPVSAGGGWGIFCCKAWWVGEGRIGVPGELFKDVGGKVKQALRKGVAGIRCTVEHYGHGRKRDG